MALTSNKVMGHRRICERLARHRLATLVGVVAVASTAGTLAVATTPAFAARHAAPTTVIVEKTAWGQILALSSGWTVYRLVGDGANKSTCSGACARAWPPVLLAPGQKTPTGKGVAHLSSFARSGGERQVSYEGIPLYRFVGDKKAGEINGNVHTPFGQWWVVNPAHPKSTPVKTAPTPTTKPTATTSAPTTAAPLTTATTAAPGTVPQTTGHPSTVAPTTAAPTTAAPTTAAPTTAAAPPHGGVAY
jgi:predicted lipoprotein with Yx(FWY)xxD motif